LGGRRVRKNVDPLNDSHPHFACGRKKGRIVDIGGRSNQPHRGRFWRPDPVPKRGEKVKNNEEELTGGKLVLSIVVRLNDGTIA